MADSSLLGLGVRETRRGGSSSQGGAAVASGLEVRGIGETTARIRDWQALALYIVGFTSKAVAHIVLTDAKKHAPYDTGELYDSGYVKDSGGPGGVNTTVAESLGISAIDSLGGEGGTPMEGSERYAALITNIQTSFTQRDYFGTGMRTFHRYVVGFSAPHAALIHENPRGIKFNPGPITLTTKQRMPYPNEQKKDHFLLDAFNNNRDRYSQAMMANFQRLDAAFTERQSGAYRPAPAAGLSSGAGRPRLVRPGGR